MLYTVYHDIYELCSEKGAPHETTIQTHHVFQVFDYLVHLLCSLTALPEISQLVALFEQLLEKKDISSCVVVGGEDVSLLLLGDVVQSAVLGIPATFPAQVLHDPMWQIGMMTNWASRGKDFFFQRVDQRSEERACAYQAEILLFLQRLHAVECIAWKPASYQQSVLQRFPQGVKSAPSGLLYPTPSYPLVSRYPSYN